MSADSGDLYDLGNGPRSPRRNTRHDWYSAQRCTTPYVVDPPDLRSVCSQGYASQDLALVECTCSPRLFRFVTFDQLRTGTQPPCDGNHANPRQSPNVRCSSPT